MLPELAGMRGVKDVFSVEKVVENFEAFFAVGCGFDPLVFLLYLVGVDEVGTGG